MRIRTDDDYAYRSDLIEQVSEFYGENKTASITNVGEDIPRLARAGPRPRRSDDRAQKQAIAGVFHVGESFCVEYDETISVRAAD